MQNSSKYSSVESKQLESMLSVAKSSIQYRAYGNGHFKAALATEDELPTWAVRDIAGAGSAVISGAAVVGATIAGPWGYFGAILGTGAIASMI